MNKMFAKHLQELVELRFRHNNRPEIAEDVQHVATTIKRPQKRGLLVNAENEGKRPRLLKDKLQDVHTSKKAPTPLRDRVLSKSTTSELLHDAITPLPTADTERRRSGRLTRSSLSREEVSSLPYEFPEEERYSKKHGLGKSWKKPLIFPPAGKKRATVDFDDLPRLDEGQFLNDNLIEFYLRRLSHTIETEKPREVKNIYWFNTYFFATLTQPTRGKGGAINFDGVKKWTRGEDLFNYDYIVVPINESAHWYVAIICNLPYLDRGLPDELADVPEHVVVDASPVETLNKGDQSEGSSDLVDLVELINASTNKSSPQDEPQLLEPDSSEPEVKGTTGSFSNLSLDDKPKSPMQNERVPVNPNEDMLFDEEKSGTLSAADEPKDNSVTARESTQDEVIEIVAPSKAEEPRVSPTAVTKRRPGQRMGRRKSAPVRRYDPSTPAIIILDSLGIEHAPTISVLKAYLEEEAKDKRGGMEFDRNRLQGMNAKGIPRQDNFCDCGLYLLGYMDKFVEDPRKFVTKLLRKEFDEREDWPDLKPSTMRNNIRELLVELHAEQEGAKPDKRKAAMRVSDTRPNIDPSNEVAGLKPSADDRHVTPPETRESTTNSPPSAQLTANLIQHLEDTAKAIGEDEQPKTSEISQPSPDEVTVIVPDSQDDQPIQTMAERPLEPPATEETRPEEPLTRSKSVEEVLKENIQSPIVPTSQESSKEAILGGEEDKARKNIRRSRNRYEPVPRPSQLVPSVVID